MLAAQMYDQPIVLVGGFMASWRIYQGLARVLQTLSSQPVLIVPTHGPEWSLAVARLGWVHLLRKLERTVNDALVHSATGKVTLVGHSAGGVLGRLYTGDRPLLGRTFPGASQISLLISLGSPHYNTGGLKRGGKMANWVQERYPDAYHEHIRYVSVAGRAIKGNSRGTAQQRRVGRIYRSIWGDPNVWGDGLVPLQSALLEGTLHVQLEHVWHFSLRNQDWYGSSSVVPRWWSPAIGAEHSRNRTVSSPS